MRDSGLRGELRELLGEGYDLERLAARVATARATPRDLAALARTLALLPKVKARLTARRSARLAQLEAALELCPEVRSAIEAALVDDPPLAIKEGGLIRPGYHSELDRLRSVSKDGKVWIARYQAEQIRRTGIPGLKVGFNQVFGYYIEITHAQAQRVEIPSDYIRKQTVKNAERYITPELKEYEDEVRSADERASALEYELFTTLRDRVSADAPRLIQAGSVLAQLDVLAALAELAARHGYCRPELAAEPVFEVEARPPSGARRALAPRRLRAQRHPPRSRRRHDPPDHRPEHGRQEHVHPPGRADHDPGPDRQLRPREARRIGVVDRLFARVGATDELSRGQSTFMVEMTETANILNNATPRSLVILDEIGRGTSTFDGISLAWAITEHIHDAIGCRTLFATHYHELVELEKTKPRLRNANVAVSESQGEIVFLHRIVPGGADQSYGIHVARLAGVPAPVLDRAREILTFLEKQHGPDPGLPEGPIRRKVKTGRALSGSLFAALPDPLLVELREIDLAQLSPAEALDVIKRLRELAG